MSFLPLLLAPLIAAIRLPCPCIRFNQTGRFFSPDYPQRLPITPCLLYHFIAPPRHIVRLSFDFFAFPSHRETQCNSGLSVWESSPDGQVDLFVDAPDAVFCGKDLHAGAVLHSVARHLLLAVRTEVPAAGFAGEYEFLSRNFHIIHKLLPIARIFSQLEKVSV